MTNRVSILCLMLFTIATTAQLEKNAILFDDFIMQGRDEQGRQTWELNGEHATMKGNIVEIKELDVHLFAATGSVTRVLSPQCTFNKTTRIGKSQAPIQVVGENMTLQGTGYDLLADQQKLIIRTNVTMWIKHGETVIDTPEKSTKSNTTEKQN